MPGYIKDYRQELQSDIWIMPPMYHRVWQWIKYSVNHTDNEIPMRDGTKFLVHRGQRMTSYRQIAKETGYYEGLLWKEPNPKTVKTICDWLEKNNMISQQHGVGNRQYTLVTVVNWDLYQGGDDEGVTAEKQQVLTKVTEKKQLVDINKNEKNDKNEKNEKKKDTIGEYTKNLELIEAIKDFSEMRTKIKKPLTDKALKLILKNLDSLTSDENIKIAILNQSIEHCWQGVFELKDNKGKGDVAKNGGYKDDIKPNFSYYDKEYTGPIYDDSEFI